MAVRVGVAVALGCSVAVRVEAGVMVRAVVGGTGWLKVGSPFGDGEHPCNTAPAAARAAERRKSRRSIFRFFIASPGFVS